MVYTGSLGGAFDADPGPGEVTVRPVGPFDATTVSLTSAGAFEWASSVTGAAPGDNGLDVVLNGGRAFVTGRFSASSTPIRVPA